MTLLTCVNSYQLYLIIWNNGHLSILSTLWYYFCSPGHTLWYYCCSPGHILLLCILILNTADLPRIGPSSYGVVYVFLYHVIDLDITVALLCCIMLLCKYAIHVFSGTMQNGLFGINWLRTFTHLKLIVIISRHIKLSFIVIYDILRNIP